MKIHFLIGVLVICLASAVRGQDTLRIQFHPVEKGESILEIKIQEVPELIRQKLASRDYSTWTFQSAYIVQGEMGELQIADSIDYIIELRKDNETIRVRFDDAGNRKADRNDQEQQ